MKKNARLIFDFELISDIEVFDPIGQIAANHIGAVVSLLFAGTKPYWQQQGAFNEIEIGRHLFRLDPVHDASDEFAGGAVFYVEADR